MRRFSMVVFFVVVLVASQATSQVGEEHLVKPGVGIGKWTLEMTMAQLIEMNRRPESQRGTTADFAPGTWLHDWYQLGLRATTLGRNEQRIASLVAMDVPYKTAKGLNLEASRDVVEAAYGKPTTITYPEPGDTHTQRLIYDEIGLFVVIDHSIGVFRPGEGKQLYKY